MIARPPLYVANKCEIEEDCLQLAEIASFGIRVVALWVRLTPTPFWADLCEGVFGSLCFLHGAKIGRELVARISTSVWRSLHYALHASIY